MKAFSVARTFSAGVDLIERKPWTLVWWAAAIVILVFVPRYLLPQLMGSADVASTTTGAPIGQFTAHAEANSPAQILQQFQQSAASSHRSLGESLLWALWVCFYSAVLNNAVFRAVLEPQKSSFGFLRLGAAEFWQFLVQATIYVMVFLATLGLLFLSFFVVLSSAALAAPWSSWLLVAYIILVVILVYWVVLRLSLGPAMTFAQSNYRLFHSWAATKSSVWRLFWTGTLSFALIIGLCVQFFFAIFLFFVPIGAVWQGLVQLMPGLAGLQPTSGAVSLEVVLFLLAMALIDAVLRAITIAPWAAAYRELYGEKA